MRFLFAIAIPALTRGSTGTISTDYPQSSEEISAELVVEYEVQNGAYQPKKTGVVLRCRRRNGKDHDYTLSDKELEYIREKGSVEAITSPHTFENLYDGLSVGDPGVGYSDPQIPDNQVVKYDGNMAIELCRNRLSSFFWNLFGR